MHFSLYPTSQNLSSDFSKTPALLDGILAFENKKQIKNLLKITSQSYFDEVEIENYLQTITHNLYFLIEKCHKIAVILGQFKDFPESDKLKDLQFLVFDISQKSNKILEKNQISIFAV